MYTLAIVICKLEWSSWVKNVFVLVSATGLIKDESVKLTYTNRRTNEPMNLMEPFMEVHRK